MLLSLYHICSCHSTTYAPVNTTYAPVTLPHMLLSLYTYAPVTLPHMVLSLYRICSCHSTTYAPVTTTCAPVTVPHMLLSLSHMLLSLYHVCSCHYRICSCHSTTYVPVTLPHMLLSLYHICSCHSTTYAPVTLPHLLLSLYNICSCHSTTYAPVTLPHMLLSLYHMYPCLTYARHGSTSAPLRVPHTHVAPSVGTHFHRYYWLNCLQHVSVPAISPLQAAYGRHVSLSLKITIPSTDRQITLRYHRYLFTPKLLRKRIRTACRCAILFRQTYCVGNKANCCHKLEFYWTCYRNHVSCVTELPHRQWKRFFPRPLMRHSCCSLSVTVFAPAQILHCKATVSLLSVQKHKALQIRYPLQRKSLRGTSPTVTILSALPKYRYERNEKLPAPEQSKFRCS